MFVSAAFFPLIQLSFLATQITLIIKSKLISLMQYAYANVSCLLAWLVVRVRMERRTNFVLRFKRSKGANPKNEFTKNISFTNKRFSQTIEKRTKNPHMKIFVFTQKISSGRIEVNIDFIDVVDASAKNAVMSKKMSVKREKVSSQCLSCSFFLNKSQNP